MLNTLLSWFGCGSCRKHQSNDVINNMDLISDSQDILSQEILNNIPPMKPSPYDLIILMPNLFNNTNN